MENKKTFKDFIEEDLDVFFNLDEFATEYELDGEVVPVIIVENNLNNNSAGIAKEHYYASQEVYKSVKTVYVKTDDFYVPKVESEITLDNKGYYVEDATEEQGIIRIILSANES